MPNYNLARSSWCGDQAEPYACYKEANAVWDCRVVHAWQCGARACAWSPSVAPPATPPGITLTPSCEHDSVGEPNCGDQAKCLGEYHGAGNSWTLKASSDTCAYVTFRTALSLQDIKSIDADVRIAGGTCSKLDNLAFWFFQAAETHNGIPEQMWDPLSEVDLMETYIGPGAVNSVNTNFAATGVPVHWPGVTITGGVRKHVTMWVDTANSQGCPATRPASDEGGPDLPIVSIYVAHCQPGGGSCCPNGDCAALQGIAPSPFVARACITVKAASVLLVLSNWGAGHRVTPGCEIGADDIQIQRRR